MNANQKIFLTIAVFGVLSDQIAKNAALFFLSKGPLYAGDFFGLEVYKNFGAAFGIPVSGGLFYAAIFVFLVFLFFGKFLDLRRLDSKQAAGMAFLLAGAAGNMIDRLRFGYIIDFINIGNIFIFNLADAFLLIGAFLLLEKTLKIKFL